MDRFARYPSLEGRTVIISGGASGIGEALVRAFAANGARVAFLDIQDEAAKSLVASVASTGAPEPLFQKCDLLDVPALQLAIDVVRERLGPAAVLINNAADDRRAKFEEVALAEFDRMIGVNFRHVFFAAQRVLPQMRELGFGSIINMTSGTWVRGVPNLEAYGSAKAAIVGLTNILVRDVGKERIRVNAIMPGAILTEKQRQLWFPTQAAIDTMVALQCLPDPVPPDDVARMALFLAADDSRHITKQVMAVNGGLN
jgi:NAD(P)-dependent dehydrogenase (short-subunit alcohol dehydrogenase family)